MTITTKYDVGDSAWVMTNNMVKNIKIHSLDIKISKDSEIRIIYNTYNIVVKSNLGEIVWDQFMESSIFSTKEELLKSL